MTVVDEVVMTTAGALAGWPPATDSTQLVSDQVLTVDEASLAPPADYDVAR